MPTVSKDMLDLEKGFWTGDEAYYRGHVDKTCLVAFAEMAQVMDRDAIAATAKSGNRWKRLAIEPKGYVEPTADTAILTYEAKATRQNGEPYHAYVSTAYVKRDGAWRMAFHQQTPLTDKQAVAPQTG